MQTFISIIIVMFSFWRSFKNVNNHEHTTEEKEQRVDSLWLQSIIPRSIIIHYNILFKYDLTEMSVCLTVEEIIFHSLNEMTGEGSECHERARERFFFIIINFWSRGWARVLSFLSFYFKYVHERTFFCCSNFGKIEKYFILEWEKSNKI